MTYQNQSATRTKFDLLDEVFRHPTFLHPQF